MIEAEHEKRFSEGAFFVLRDMEKIDADKLRLAIVDQLRIVNDGQYALSEMHPMPAISEGFLHSAISSLSTSWSLTPSDADSPPFHVLKTPIKRIVKRMVQWIYKPVIERQMENNLTVVRILDILTRVAVAQSRRHYGNSAPNKHIILTANILRPKSRLDDLIVMYRYIQCRLDPLAQLIVIVKEVADPIYRDYIMSIIEELKIRNIYLYHDPEPRSLKDYCKMAGILISFDRDKDWLASFPELSELNVPFLVTSGNLFWEPDARMILCDPNKTEETAILTNMLLKDMRIRNDLLYSPRRYENLNLIAK